LQREPGQGEKAVLLVLMVLVATLSWRFVERPARSTTMRTGGILALGISVIFVAAIAGTAINASNGLEQRFDAASRAFFASARDFNPRRAECHASDARPVRYDAKCVFGDRARLTHPGVAVWADSHGAELVYALSEALTSTGDAVAQITYSSCPPALGFNPSKVSGCVQHNAKALQALAADRDIKTVVMAAHYDIYMRQDAAAFTGGLEKSIAGLREAGKHVVLVAPMPTYDYPVPQALGMQEFWGGSGPTKDVLERSAHHQRHARLFDALGVMRGRDRFTLFDPADVLCASGQCVTSADGKAMYFDSHHVSLSGAARLSEAMMSILRAERAASTRTTTNE